MKHILLILSLLVIGCSSNQVTLAMRDGAKIESELLSVRDSSIVIQEKGGAPIAIRNEDVDSVLYDAGSSLPYTIGGSIVFAGLGVWISGWRFSGQSEYDNPAVVIPGALIGAAAGWVIGGLVSPDDKLFHMYSLNDRRALIQYAKYHPRFEPDELKKIK